MWATLRRHLVPQLLKPKSLRGSGVERALRPRDFGLGHLTYLATYSRWAAVGLCRRCKLAESTEPQRGALERTKGATAPRVDNRCRVAEMPLTRLKNEYLEQDGVRFLMEDAEGSAVACSVSDKALRDHAERVHLSGTDAAIFEAYRELIEQVASDAYDAEGPFDDNERVLVTSEALTRVTRRA